jgi:hypothetical protein
MPLCWAPGLKECLISGLLSVHGKKVRSGSRARHCAALYPRGSLMLCCSGRCCTWTGTLLRRREASNNLNQVRFSGSAMTPSPAFASRMLRLRYRSLRNNGNVALLISTRYVHTGQRPRRQDRAQVVKLASPRTNPRNSLSATRGYLPDRMCIDEGVVARRMRCSSSLYSARNEVDSLAPRSSLHCQLVADSL